MSRRSNGTVDEVGTDDSQLLALDQRYQPTRAHHLDQFLQGSSEGIACQPFLEKVLGKEPDVLQSDGTDHVYDNTVLSVSWSFPGLELNVNELQARIGSLWREYSTKMFWVPRESWQ